MIKNGLNSKLSFSDNGYVSQLNCSFLSKFSTYWACVASNSARSFLLLLILVIPNFAVAIHPLEPADTTSPRATIQSFLTISDEVAIRYLEYRNSPGPSSQKALEQILSKGWRLLDLSQVALAAQQEVADETFILLWEVIARLELPVPGDIPDQWTYTEDEKKQHPVSWRIPNTDITIHRVKEGPRQGEYLFSPDTVSRIREFYETIHEQPYLRPMPTDNLYRNNLLFSGWMIPITWVEALPEWANKTLHNQVLWKWFALLLLIGMALLTSIAVFRWSCQQPSRNTFRAYLRLMSTPITLFLLIPLLRYMIRDQINVTSTGKVPYYILEIIFGAAVIWAIWLTSKWIADAIINSPKIKENSLDAHLLRLAARLVGILAIAIFIFQLLNLLGVPVYGLVAGAGVGGIAIALAAKDTLENFMGTLNLFADRSVNIGDLCRYDDDSISGWHPIGRIEEIGLRSTKIRRFDRTLITIPNADFSQRHIVNMQSCDRFLLNTTLGLRYETTDDQLRFLLIELRELMHAHPKTIHSIADPVRVRFCGFGDYSLNVCIRVYIRTTDYNEFLAIQEDLLLRMMNVVKKAGTGFAFPSQTLYYARDGGLDNEQQKNAEKQVREWASAQTLAFPDFEEKYRQQITDTLDYPPEGSPGAD